MKKRREITTNRPAISDAEINQYKQEFNNILDKFSNMTSGGAGLGSAGSWAIGVVAATAIGIGSWFISDKINNEQADIQPTNIVQAVDTLKENGFIEKAGINPPMPEKLVFEEYSVNNSKATSITTESGTKIHIPKKAFVDINGNPIKGDVNIEFKDYHNPLEFFISGIPMDYDSSGTNYTFESGGMFQIFAKQNNKEVYLADNKYIDIDLVSKSEERFNFYEYDTTGNNWKYERTETSDDYEILAEKKAEIEKEVEEYEDYSLMPESDFENTLTDESIRYRVPTSIRNPERFAVNVPSASGVKNMYEILPGQDFKEEYYRVRWDDIRVERIPDNNEFYELQLIKDKTTKVYKAYPVISKEEQERIASNIEKRKEEKAARIAKQKKYSKEIAKKRRDIEKVQMLINSGYVSNRNIRVYNLGSYNCDRPIPRPIMARRGKGTPVDSLGNRIKYNSLYIAQSKNNSIFNYPYNQRWYYSGATENIMWALTPDYEVAILTPEKFDKVGSSSTKLEFDVYNADEGIEILERYFN